MSIESSSIEDLKFYRAIHAKNYEKRTSVSQIVQETRVCDYAASYCEDVNQYVLARADQPFRILLQIDEADNASNDVCLSNEERRYLNSVADPPAIDFVDSAIEKLKIANKMLRSFKLRLTIAIEPGDF
jgi:hypothetical protein